MMIEPLGALKPSTQNPIVPIAPGEAVRCFKCCSSKLAASASQCFGPALTLKPYLDLLNPTFL